MDAPVGALVFGALCVLLVLGPAVGLPLYAVITGFRRRNRVRSLLEQGEPRVAELVRSTTEPGDVVARTTLVMGNVAYAADAPSRWATTWRTLVGGRLQSMSDQTDLARRLAVLRMLEQAEGIGATAVANVRIETSEIFSGSGQRARLVIELLAYGTALLPVAEAAR